MSRWRGFFLSASAILLSAAFLATPCLAHHIAVVVDKDNKTQNITSAHLAKIVKGEVKKWPDGRNVVLVLHATLDEVGTLARLTKMTDAEVKAMIDERKNNDKDKDSIVLKTSDAEVIETVASTPGAIGMVEEHSISGRVSVIKVDGKLPLESGYLPH
ncbi:MAG: substrate-binding domain-containing protein [Terriglobales bacterium]|jgi:ABC-type phosphate transport system substrate-binding protein